MGELRPPLPVRGHWVLVLAVVPRGLAASRGSAFIQVGAVLQEPQDLLTPALTHRLME